MTLKEYLDAWLIENYGRDNLDLIDTHKLAQDVIIFLVHGNA